MRSRGADLHFTRIVKGAAPPKTVPLRPRLHMRAAKRPLKRSAHFQSDQSTLRAGQKGQTETILLPQRSHRGPAAAERGPLSPHIGMRVFRGFE